MEGHREIKGDLENMQKKQIVIRNERPFEDTGYKSKAHSIWNK